MKDGGKPMGPTPAEKKKSEERTKQREEDIAENKSTIIYYAEKLGEMKMIANIQKEPFWTDTVNGLKELRKVRHELEAKVDQWNAKRKEEEEEWEKEQYNGMTPHEFEKQERALYERGCQEYRACWNEDVATRFELSQDEVPNHYISRVRLFESGIIKKK